METPPPSKFGQDKDRISVLPDELLLGILERLGLRDAVRAGAVSRRWRHLPYQLSRVDLDVRDFQGTTLLETMDAFTGAARRFLSPADCKCDSKSRPTVKVLRLRLYLSGPHMESIGRAVEDTVSRGETESFELVVLPPPRLNSAGRTELRKQCMSFSSTCHVPFRWLTGLSLKRLEFRNSDLRNLIGACDKLKLLSLRSCRLMNSNSVLKIDVPNSIITELEFIRFRCRQIKLVSVPKLRRLTCRSWHSKNAPVCFGYVPELFTVDLASCAKTWQAPFALSDCFSMNTRSLSKLYLSFAGQMIWILPEHPKQLTPMFGNLTRLVLWCIFPECDLNWTLFILEAAPALQHFTLNRTRHSCVETSEDSAEKVNVAWEPSKDLKHLNLELLVMIGFEEEDKVANYIRLVMERSARIKRIQLCEQICEGCHAIDLESTRRSEVDKASRCWVKERLTHGSSSSTEIIIC